MVACPSICAFPQATAYQMVGRSPSTATPHAKRRCRRYRVATFTSRAYGTGERTVALTPAATTPYRAATKVWIAESERPRAAMPVSGGGLTCFPWWDPPLWREALCVRGWQRRNSRRVGGCGWTRHAYTPLHYLGTKILPGVPPYFPNFTNFIGLLQPPLVP